MSIKLAANEKIIRKYDYATTREGIINKRITQNSLVVTNKRIIKTDVCNRTGYERINTSEIAVDSITGVRTSATSSFKFIYLVLGIICGLLALLYIGIALSDMETLGGLVVLFLAFGALSGFSIYKFIRSRINTMVCNFVIADRINSAMQLGAISFSSISSRFNVSARPAFVKIKVDAAVAKKFVEEIGAVLIDINNGVVESEDQTEA